MIKRLALFLFLTFCLCGCTSSGDKTKLSFSTWGSASEMALVKQVVKEYEKITPGVEISIRHIPQNYFKKLHLLLASGTEPDVILINNQNLPLYSDYFYSFDKNKVVGFYPNAVDSLSVGGELKAVPRDVSTLVVYYNKSLLDKCNIPSPKVDWSMEDLLHIAALLKEQGVFALPLENDIFYVYPFIMSFGENAENILPDNMETYNSIEFFMRLSRYHHYVPMDYELGSATGAEFFLRGKSAFYLSGRWMTPKIREMAVFEWDVIRFPSVNGQSIVPCDATGWAVSKRSKHPQEALKFTEYLASETSLQTMSKSGLIVPARVSVANAKEFLAAPPKNSKLFLHLAENSKPIKYPIKYNQIKDMINLKLKSNK